MRPASSAAPRSRTRGWRTPTGPMPVITSRSGRCPCRTTRLRPVAVFRSTCLARNSATSASIAWASRARAPLRPRAAHSRWATLLQRELGQEFWYPKSLRPSSQDGAGIDGEFDGGPGGLVDRVTFHNSENGFCVLRVKARGPRDETALGLELQDGTVIADDLDGRPCVFLAGLYWAEREIEQRRREQGRDGEGRPQPVEKFGKAFLHRRFFRCG